MIDICMYMNVLLTKLIFNLYSYIIFVHINKYSVFLFLFFRFNDVIYIEVIFNICSVFIGWSHKSVLNVLFNNT